MRRSSELSWVRLGALVALTSLATACGGDESSPPGGNPNPDGGAAPDAQQFDDGQAYVFDHIIVPTTEADGQTYGLDIDGDGNVDNKLASVIENLSDFADPGSLDIQGNLDTSIADGTIILLGNLLYESLDSGAGTLHMYQGDNPSTAPCDMAECGKHLEGQTEFDIAASSPTDNRIDGTLSAGQFAGQNGKVTIPLPLGENPTSVTIIAAKAEMSATTSYLGDGLMGGGITEEEMNEKVLPAVAVLLEEQSAADCQGVAPNCCTPDTDGAQIYDLFDANDDCSITGEELADNFLLGLFLQPDLDLLDADGNLGTDGVDESLSLGIGFTAATAVIRQ